MNESDVYNFQVSLEMKLLVLDSLPSRAESASTTQVMNIPHDMAEKQNGSSIGLFMFSESESPICPGMPAYFRIVNEG